MSFRAPSMSTVAKVVGRLRYRNTQVIILPLVAVIVSEAIPASVIVLLSSVTAAVVVVVVVVVILLPALAL